MNILAVPCSFGLFKPISGGQNRFYNILNQLKKRNDVILFQSLEFQSTNDERYCRIYYYKDIKLFGRTLCILRDFNLSFIIGLLRILMKEKVDLIQMTHPSGVIVVKLITFLLQKRISMVYDAQNIESNFMKETFMNNPQYTHIEKFIVSNYIKILEKMAFNFVDLTTCVSNVDKNILKIYFKIDEKKLSTIPSGCFIPHSLSKNVLLDIRKRLNIDPNKLVVIFHGYYSNQNKEGFDFVTNYLAPFFLNSNKNILFLLCGSNLPKFSRDNIVSLGYVDDIYEILSMADMAIVPLTKGAGTKLKVLDYLCSGLPIIATEKTIVGLNIENYKQAIIVKDLGIGFVKAMDLLISDSKLRDELGKNGRKLAKEEFDWELIGEKVNALYERKMMDKVG